MNEIQKARKNAGLTQQEMSDLLFIPKRTIENWENDKRTPPIWAEKLVVGKLKSFGDKYKK